MNENFFPFRFSHFFAGSTKLEIEGKSYPIRVRNKELWSGLWPITCGRFKYNRTFKNPQKILRADKVVDMFLFSIFC